MGGKGDWVWLRKAYGLYPGWSSKRICHLCSQPVPGLEICFATGFSNINPIPYSLSIPCQDWYNASPTSMIRTTWCPQRPVARPWKNNWQSPLRDIPGGDDWNRIRIDVAHTYAIQGFGSTMATSSCILLCRFGLVRGRSMNARLEQLYLEFKAWCKTSKKTTSLTGLSLKKFKMTSQLDLKATHWRFEQVH